MLENKYKLKLSDNSVNMSDCIKLIIILVKLKGLVNVINGEAYL